MRPTSSHLIVRAAAAALVALVCSTAPAVPLAPDFLGMGEVPGRAFTDPRGVSKDGSVVVGYSRTNDASDVEAFRWTRAGGMQWLGDLPGLSDSYAYGVSGDGSTVVGGSYAGTAAAQAFRWTSAGGMQGLGFPTEFPHHALGNPAAASVAISADGSTIVGAGGANAYRWTSTGGLQRLAFPSGVNSGTASAVSADGSVFAGSWSTTFSSLFRWTNDGGFQDLGVPFGEYDGIAYAVSADGSVVAGFNGSYAFRWTSAEGTQLLGDPRFYSTARGVSADGSILVGFSEDLGAFIWDKTRGMRSIQQVLASEYGWDLTGWSLDSATAISADGNTVVGIGTHLGRTEGWIATVPEPTTLALAVPGILLLGRRRRSPMPGEGSRVRGDRPVLRAAHRAGSIARDDLRLSAEAQGRLRVGG